MPDSEPPTIPNGEVSPARRLFRTASGTNIQAQAVLDLLTERLKTSPPKK